MYVLIAIKKKGQKLLLAPRNRATTINKLRNYILQSIIRFPAKKAITYLSHIYKLL